MSEGQDTKNKPASKTKVGLIEVARWDKKPEGKDYVVSNFSLSNSYKDGEEWKESKSYSLNDIPRLIVALENEYKKATLRLSE